MTTTEKLYELELLKLQKIIGNFGDYHNFDKKPIIDSLDYFENLKTQLIYSHRQSRKNIQYEV